MNRLEVTEKIISTKVAKSIKWEDVAIKELIHEEFGDVIMSAIDFSMDIVRQPDPKGDRVNVVLSGKFLPYKQY